MFFAHQPTNHCFMRIVSRIFLLLCSPFVFAQDYAAVDQKMAQIPQSATTSTDGIAQFINANFPDKEDRLRAAFFWTSQNIDYDVANMDRLNYNQDTDEKIAYALQNRKGVCMHYAEVFKEIAAKTGNEILLVGGYTKVNGKVANVSHQWCASKVNGKWYLFDPTWAGGYVLNQKYTKRMANQYYKAEPKSLISSHMPFDYLWQFSPYPITNQEFFDGKTEAANKIKRFDFEAETENYFRLSEVEQHRATASRIEKNGLKSKMIADRLDFERMKIDNLKQQDTYTKVMDIVGNFNKANALFNEFIHYRNARFRPLVSDDEIKDKIAVPYRMMLECEAEANKITHVSAENAGNFRDIKKAIAQAKSDYAAHLEFVNEYLSKNKVGRETMFYRRIKS